MAHDTRFMLTKLALPAVTLMAAGLTACAGGGTATSSAAHAGALAVPGTGSRPTRMYTVRLSGTAETTHGAPGGRGYAIIAFHGPSMVCWRFAHLHGFFDATVAQIHSGTSGKSGRSLLGLGTGPRLHHQGCEPVHAALTRTIWSRPQGYYVTVASTRYPRGAVRAQL
ncbi:MAG TPA: CHRD domain-containing protein [Solirubrobacteraceae bacterium]|nr:CHRD domain-containing protein [Solirubrobacteraceae bacterium]